MTQRPRESEATATLPLLEMAEAMARRGWPDDAGPAAEAEAKMDSLASSTSKTAGDFCFLPMRMTR